MEFIDLKKQQSKIKTQIDTNIQNVLEHGKYILGPEVKELETKLADYTDRKYALGVSNGSDAIIITLMALNVKKDDVIFVPNFTFISSATSILYLGAKPVFVDLEEGTFNMSVDDLKKKIAFAKSNNENIKGIISVDMFGQMTDYDKLQEIADNDNLFLLEDAAQSMGASLNNQKSCHFGVIATTSFFPAKPLGCYGDGGMIFTDDEELYKTMASIRVHGKGEHKYDNVRLGMNSRLSTMQAAILLAKFDIFDNEILLRQKVAENYNKLLENVVITPKIPNNKISAWAQYTILAEDRELLRDALAEKNIPTAVYYPKLLNDQLVFADFRKDLNFPISESITDKVVSLPMHPYLTYSEQKEIADIIIDFYKK